MCARFFAGNNMQIRNIVLGALAAFITTLGVAAWATAQVGSISLFKLVGGTAIQPIRDTFTIGSNAERIAHGYFDNLTATTATITGISAGDILPSANNTYDVGAYGSAWKDIYASGTVLTNSLSIDNGSVGTPSLYFASDPNTGIWKHNTDTLGIQSGGSRAMIFGTASNLSYHDLNPDTTSARDLGATSLHWAELHADDIYGYGTLYTGSRQFTEATEASFLQADNQPCNNGSGEQCSLHYDIDSEYMLKLYAEGDGAGGIQNKSINLYPETLRVGEANSTSYMFIGAGDGCMELAFTTSSTFPTASPTSTSLCN